MDIFQSELKPTTIFSFEFHRLRVNLYTGMNSCHFPREGKNYLDREIG